MRKSSADGWHDVDYDRLLQLVDIEAGMVPTLVLAHLTEPEGSVRVVRADDALERSWPVEVADEAGGQRDESLGVRAVC